MGEWGIGCVQRGGKYGLTLAADKTLRQAFAGGRVRRMPQAQQQRIILPYCLVARALHSAQRYAAAKQLDDFAICICARCGSHGGLRLLDGKNLLRLAGYKIIDQCTACPKGRGNIDAAVRANAQIDVLDGLFFQRVVKVLILHPYGAFRFHAYSFSFFQRNYGVL